MFQICGKCKKHHSFSHWCIVTIDISLNFSESRPVYWPDHHMWPLLRTRLSAKSFSSVYRIKCRGGGKERKFLEIQCGRVKNYFGGRGIQLGSGGKEKRKEKLFDLRKKAAVIKQIQLAAYAEDRKSCLRRNYKQVRANFWLLKFFYAWIHNLCSFPKFSFVVLMQPLPNLASVSYCYH